MSEMGEIFGCIKSATKARKARRLQEFEESNLGTLLTEHSPYHKSTTLQGNRLDYWPTTCRWRWKDQNYWGTLNDFINFLDKRGWQP